MRAAGRGALARQPGQGAAPQAHRLHAVARDHEQDLAWAEGLRRLVHALAEVGGVTVHHRPVAPRLGAGHVAEALGLGEAGEGVTHHVETLVADDEEGRVIGLAQHGARPLVGDVGHQPPLHELAAPGHGVVRDLRLQVHEARDHGAVHVLGLHPPGRHLAQQRRVQGLRCPRRVVAQEVEIPGRARSLSRSAAGQYPHAHRPRLDAEGVEDVPEGAPAARGGGDRGSRRRARSAPARPPPRPWAGVEDARRARQPIRGEALDPVVARRAAGEDRGPDGRALRAPTWPEARGLPAAGPGRTRAGCRARRRRAPDRGPSRRSR